MRDMHRRGFRILLLALALPVTTGTCNGGNDGIDILVEALARDEFANIKDASGPVPSKDYLTLALQEVVNDQSLQSRNISSALDVRDEEGPFPSRRTPGKTIFSGEAR